MRYMNGYDIDCAARRYAGNSVLTDAVQTLSDLKDWTDSNSDGWAYWPKPARAAAKLMELIDGNGTYEDHKRIMSDTLASDLDAALRPIKSLRTKALNGGLTSLGRAMPWFPITAAERAELAAKRQAEADTARAESVKRLADKLAPALDLWARRIRLGVGTDVPGSRTADIARELAEIVEAGY